MRSVPTCTRQPTLRSLSIDEKTQIQCLDRTQPSLPLKPGECGTLTHDYKRRGTITLCAALKHPKVRAWLTRHPRWVLHFIPTSVAESHILRRLISMAFKLLPRRLHLKG